MTDYLFREDAYLAETEARILAVFPEGVELDRTIFYASSGGQPGDTGRLIAGGRAIAVTGAVHPEGDRTRVLHLLAADETPPGAGAVVTLALDWERRHRLMRMHSALHLLSVVLPYGVTGGSVGDDKGRLDFDMPAPPEDVAALEEALNGYVAADLPIGSEWISDAELAARPEMVKTMKVKPPMGQGRVRLVRIGTEEETVDLQPCGGTHVRSTAEIGRLRIGKIEKKGRENRRVNLHFAD
jgi:misacylated tRNA(Ala) deacylase